MSSYYILIIVSLVFQSYLVLSDYTMVITWGRVTNASDPNTTAAVSWDQCVSLCYNSLYCVLAFGRFDYCSLYNFGTVYEVQKWPPADEIMVAFKTSFTDVSCPENPIENSQVEILDPTFPYTSFTYSLTYSNDLWTYVYSVNRTCPPNWKTFNRPTTEYCLKLFTNLNAKFTQPQAAARCLTVNATLGGLESEEERLYAYGEALPVTQEDTYKGGGFWLDGYRKESCRTVEQWNTTECYQTKAFDFTDQYLTTYSGYQWVEGRPDGINATGAYQLCIMMWAQKAEAQLSGYLDDSQCDLVGSSYFAFRGFLCGKVPGI